MAREHNAFGEKIYFWVDDEGIRCSPRHQSMKAALNYFKNNESYWVTDPDTRRPRQIDRDRQNLPSQKQPVELKTGEYLERALSDEEQAKLDQVRALMAEGYV